LRAFVALEISEPKVLDALVAFQLEMSRTGSDLKLVERENLHFTVKFLGEITETQAKDADSRLKRLHLSPAQVEVRGVGAFPNIGSPNVVWVGVPEAQEGLVVQIAKPAIEALEGIGESEHRPFRAHATLARLRSRREPRELASLLSANSDRDFGPLALKDLKLKSSVLSPSGPTYSDVGVYPLG
jgi:2'-5' RNA ligase